MQALISCTHCHKQLRIPEAVLGKPVKCPLCNSTFAAPATSQQPPEAPTVPLDPVDKPTAPVKPPVRKDSQVDRTAGIASKPAVKSKASSRLHNGVEDVVTIDPIDEPIRPAKSKKEKSGSTPWYLLLLSALPLGIIVVLVLGGWLAGMGGLKSVFIGFGLGVGVAGVCVLLNMIGGLHVALRALGTLFLTFVGYVSAIAIVVIALINRVPVVDPNPNDFFPIDVNNVVVKDEPKIVVVQPTDWRPHVSELGRFAVQMPGAVQTNQIRPPGEFGEHREVFHEYQDQAVVFRVMFDDNLRTQFKDLEGDAEMALRIQRERLARPGGKVLVVKDVRSDKYGGKEFEVALPDDGFLVARQFLAAGRYYEVSIRSKPKTRLAADDVLRFFESFKIIPGKDVVIKPPPDQPVEPGPGPEPRPRNGAEPVPATKIAGLIGYWAFDEGRGRQAEDASERHTNAELQGAKWTTGVRGKGLYFDGSAWLDYSNSPSYNFRALAPFTFCGWVQTSQPNGTIVSQRNDKDGGAVIHVSVEDGRLCAVVRQDSRDFGPHAAVRGALVNDGQWHHFALTRNQGDTIELFLDGVSQGKGSGALAEGAITTNLRALGSERFWVKTNFKPPEHRFLIGWADELCLFDRQLDSKDLRQLAGNPEVAVEPPVKPPVPPVQAAEDLKLGPKIESFLTAVVAPKAKGAMVFTGKGELLHYAYPDFKLLGTYPLGAVVYQSVLNPASGLLYAATAAPPGVEGSQPDQLAIGTGELRVYDIRSILEGKGAPGQLKHTAVLAPDVRTPCLALSPDGLHLYYLDVKDAKTGKLVRYNTKTGQKDGELKLPDGPHMMCLARDGKLAYALAASGDKGKVQVIDAPALQLLREVPLPAEPYWIDANNEGVVFISLKGLRPDIVVMDVLAKETLSRYDGLVGFCPVQLTPDMKRLYASICSQGPGVMRSYALPATLNEKPLGGARAESKEPFGRNFFIAPDGQFLLTRSGQVLHLGSGEGAPDPVKPPDQVKPPDPVKPPPGRPITIRETASSDCGVNSYVHALAFAPDGKTLFVGGDNGKARYWTLAPLREVNAIELHKGSIVSLSVSKDGRYLATGAIDGQAKVVDIKEQRAAVTLSSTARGFIHVAISADGTQLVTASSAAQLWDVGKGEVKHALKTPKKFHDAVAFAPDGKTVATGSTDKSIQLFAAATGQEKAVLRGHDGPIMSLAFSSDGRLLASASSDQTVKVWDVATGQERLTLRGHNDPLSSVAWSPDGRFLVSGAGAIRFNPGDAGEVKLWDATTGAHLADLVGHKRGVSSVAFAPNGRTVASASRDNTIKLWDVSKAIQSQR